MPPAYRRRLDAYVRRLRGSGLSDTAIAAAVRSKAADFNPSVSDAEVSTFLQAHGLPTS